MVATIVKNHSEFIKKAIHTLVEALVVGAILLCIVLFVFMRNTKSILIIITTLPLSLLMSVILLYSSKLTFNVMTLSGLAMGIGNVMDTP